MQKVRQVWGHTSSASHRAQAYRNKRCPAAIYLSFYIDNTAGAGRGLCSLLKRHGAAHAPDSVHGRWVSMQTMKLPAMTFAAFCTGNTAGEGREVCEVLIANGATLPMGHLLLRAAKDQSSYTSHAAICAAWALSNLLFSCPAEVGPCSTIECQTLAHSKALRRSYCSNHEPLRAQQYWKETICSCYYPVVWTRLQGLHSLFILRRPSTQRACAGSSMAASTY